MSNTDLRFKIVEEKLGTILSYSLYDSKTGEYVSILPEYGGAINAMALLHKGELVEIMNGYTGEEDIKSSLHTSFKGSNLFPFPNRIRDGKYNFQDNAYQLNVNFPHESNAIHGLVFETPFKVVEKEDGEIGCTLTLEYYSQPAVGFPFKYMMKVVYQLKEGSGFECQLKLANLMDQSIPVGHGWHPYFKAGTDVVDDISLQFPAEHLLLVDDRSIPIGKEEAYNAFNTLKPIGDTVLDSCFSLLPGESCARTTLLNPATGFGYVLWQETGKYKYNFLQIYTPPDRKSIAIEPMTCAPNAFNNGQGLIILGPFESIYTSFGISHLE